MRRRRLRLARGHRWFDETTGRVVWPPPAPGGDPERPLYFLHIPKASGTSLDGFLRSMYRREDVCPAYLDEQLDELGSSSLNRYRYIAGHFSLRPLEILGKAPAVVTVVREPSVQLRSLYDQGLRLPESENPRHWVWAGRTFAQWLRDPETEFLTRNFQAQYLAGTVYTPSKLDDDELYERAVATLERCLWFSTAEHLRSSMPRLAVAVRWPAPARLPRLNVAPVPAPPVSAEELELVQERCPVDLRIYRYVASRVRVLDDGVWSRSFERALDRACTALTRPLVVEFREPFWGTGWWPAEARLHINSFRWTVSGTTATVDLPVRLRPGDRIDLFVAAAVDPRFVTDMVVETNGHRANVGHIHPCPPHFVVPAVVARDAGGWTRVSVRSPGAGDDEVIVAPERGDPRSVAVERMVLVPGGAAQA